MVRTEYPSGNVQYYEGESGAERMVQAGASEDKAAAEKRYKAMRVAEERVPAPRLGHHRRQSSARGAPPEPVLLLNSRAQIRS